jgi:hypothetical protein
MPSRKASKQTSNSNQGSNTVDTESPIGILIKMFTEGKINQTEFLNTLAVLQLGIGTVHAPQPPVWTGGKNRRSARKNRLMQISRKIRK